MTTAEQLAALQPRWPRLLARYGVGKPAADQPLRQLINAYSAPNRFYHTIEHLAEMFPLIDRLAQEVDDPSVVELAVWFHDAVYDPHAGDNEERSAKWARELLTPLRVPSAALDRMEQLIRATAHVTPGKLPIATRPPSSTPILRFSVRLRNGTCVIPRMFAANTSGYRRPNTEGRGPGCSENSSNARESTIAKSRSTRGKSQHGVISRRKSGSWLDQESIRRPQPSKRHRPPPSGGRREEPRGHEQIHRESPASARRSQKLAARLNHQQIDAEHVLLSLLDQEKGLAPAILQKAGVSVDAAHDQAPARARKAAARDRPAGGAREHLRHAAASTSSLPQAEDEAKKLKDEYVSVEHLLLAADRRHRRGRQDAQGVRRHPRPAA